MFNPSGVFSAVLAYFIWGLVPAYWKQLQHISSIEILAHRTLWAFIFFSLVAMIFTQKKDWAIFLKIKEDWWTSLISSLLLACNWGVYIWAVNSNQIIESSLGYFLNPLVNILLGVVILKERLDPLQKWAVGLAACGSLILTLGLGRPPWIALILAITFAFYGLLRKRMKAPVWVSSSMETLWLVPLSLAWLFHLKNEGSGPSYELKDQALLVASGLVTGLPLLFFARAAQLLPLSRLGFFQYISPSMQFLLGVFIYQETLSRYHYVAFPFIWMALLLISWGAKQNWRAQRQKPPPI